MQCEYCVHFWIDEEDGAGECMVNLDEDDLSRLMESSYES